MRIDDICNAVQGTNEIEDKRRGVRITDRLDLWTSDGGGHRREDEDDED